jgi:hypothetical protein
MRAKMPEISIKEFCDFVSFEVLTDQPVALIKFETKEAEDFIVAFPSPQITDLVGDAQVTHGNESARIIPVSNLDVEYRADRDIPFCVLKASLYGAGDLEFSVDRNHLTDLREKIDRLLGSDTPYNHQHPKQ